MRRRAVLVLVAALLAVGNGVLVLLAPPPPPAAAAPVALTAPSGFDSRVYGSGPLADVLYWADQQKKCGLSRDQLAAMMLAPNYPETGAGTLYAPSPMTLSRWDTQSGLYAFGDKATPYQKAFFHPGIGMWQFDSAGGWNLTAAGAISSYTSAQTAATMMASRWCVNPTRAYAWAAWFECVNTTICETIYNEIFDGTSLVNVSQDLTVSRDGGMQTRSCDVWGIGPVTCYYVDPAQAQGYKAWAAPSAGPSPITAPFYVFASNGNEYRYWLAQDTGYGSTIMATKPITANARTSLTWALRDDLCDKTAVRGACDRSPFGHLDTASGGPGSLTVQGWTIDPDTNGAIAAHVYVDGVATAALTADQPRPDVGASYPLFGSNHGFSATLSGMAGGPHTVCAYGINVGAGGNALLGCLAATVPSGSPVGYVDATQGGAGAIWVRGWTIDPDTTASIAAHVYVDGVGLGVTTASLDRPDIGAALPAYGSAHGFALTVGGALAPGNHTVCVYGINVGLGSNSVIGCTVVNVASGPPVGALDVATTAFGTVSLRGWAVDPDTTSPITVHVYIDGVGRGAFTASAPRADLALVLPVWGGNHGFDLTLSPFGGGTHSICVYGINVGPGANNAVGCTTVTGSGSPGGSFDQVAVAPGVVTVQGWAIDPDTTGAAKVQVTLDGAPLGTGSATTARSDIATSLPGYGPNHGFSLTLSGVGGGAHSVCVTALNTVATGTDTALGCKNVQSSGEPFGALDQATISSGVLTVRGWAIDPDTTGSVTVHVYVDGVGVGILSTNQPRPDVAAIWPAYGPNTGYQAAIAGMGGGPHNVCTYAINTGPGTSNTLLGCVAA